MAENNSAAAMAMSTAPMKVETLSGFPGFGGNGQDFGFDPLKYRVRYGKYDLDDMGAVSELEIIETQGLAGKEIVVLNKDKFTFMDKYIMIVTYLELIEEV